MFGPRDAVFETQPQVPPIDGWRLSSLAGCHGDYLRLLATICDAREDALQQPAVAIAASLGWGCQITHGFLRLRDAGHRATDDYRSAGAFPKANERGFRACETRIERGPHRFAIRHGTCRIK